MLTQNKNGAKLTSCIQHPQWSFAVSYHLTGVHQHQSWHSKAQGGRSCAADPGGVGRDQDVPLGSHQLLEKLTCLRLPFHDPQLTHSLSTQHRCPLSLLHCQVFGKEKSWKYKPDV